LLLSIQFPTTPKLHSYFRISKIVSIGVEDNQIKDNQIKCPTFKDVPKNFGRGSVEPRSLSSFIGFFWFF
jgi:hypothetical protein